MRPSACADDIGVAQCDGYDFERHAQQIGRHLGEAGLVALSRRLCADHHFDTIVRMDDEVGAFLGRSDRGFDVVRKTKPEQLAAPLRIRSPLLGARPVGQRQHPVHVRSRSHRCRRSSQPRLHMASVGTRRDCWRRSSQTVEAEFARRLVNQAFDRKRHLGPTGAAIGLRGHRVGIDGARAQVAWGI